MAHFRRRGVVFFSAGGGKSAAADTHSTSFRKSNVGCAAATSFLPRIGPRSHVSCCTCNVSLFEKAGRACTLQVRSHFLRLCMTYHRHT